MAALLLFASIRVIRGLSLLAQVRLLLSWRAVIVAAFDSSLRTARERVMRLGVFLPNWVGDVVMATPALRSLRKLAGDGQLIGVMRPYVAEVLGGCTWFDETILYAKKAKDTELAWPAVRGKLRDAKLEAVVLLTNSLRTAWMAYRSGAREGIGTAGNLRSPLLTTKVYMPRRGWRAAPPPTVLGY